MPGSKPQEARWKPFAPAVSGRPMAREEAGDVREAVEGVRAEANRGEVGANHSATEEGDAAGASRGAPCGEEVPEEAADACLEVEVAAVAVAKDPSEPASGSHHPVESCCTHEQRPMQKLLGRHSPLRPLVFCPFPNRGQPLQLVWKRQRVSRTSHLSSIEYRMHPACDAILCILQRPPSLHRSWWDGTF